MFTAAAVLAIAMTCHEANRAYCAYLGDDSQKPWADAPDWQRESALKGVEFHLANPDAGDAASHDSWMAQKVADGWVYGETKDEEKKTHPCIVPFDQLPKEQQFKDALFRAIVHGAADVVALGNQTEELKAKITELEKVAAQPKAAPKAKASGGKADKIGPVPALSDDARRELDLALEAGAAFTVVPSDGKHALRALDRTEISGEAWRRDGTRMRLNLPLVLTPQGRCTVAGFGLVDAAGKQVAWCPLPEPVTLAAGSETSFRDSIHF